MSSSTLSQLILATQSCSVLHVNTHLVCGGATFIRLVLVSGSADSTPQPLFKVFPELLADCNHSVRMCAARAVGVLFTRLTPNTPYPMEATPNSPYPMEATPKSHQAAAFELVSQMLVQSLFVEVGKRDDIFYSFGRKLKFCNITFGGRNGRPYDICLANFSAKKIVFATVEGLARWGENTL